MTAYLMLSGGRHETSWDGLDWCDAICGEPPVMGCFGRRSLAVLQ